MSRLLVVLLAALCALSAGPLLATTPHISTSSALPAPGQVPAPLAPMLFGDGQDGMRVQAIYAYNPIPTIGNHFDTYRPSLLSILGYIDAAYLASAQRHDPNSYRRVRWVTDATGTPTFLQVGSCDFSQYQTSWTQANRLWFVLEEGCPLSAPGVSQVGGYAVLPQPGQENLAPNVVNGVLIGRYAVAGLSSILGDPLVTHNALHEMAHALGAVESGAPNEDFTNHLNVMFDILGSYACALGWPQCALLPPPVACSTDTAYLSWVLDCLGTSYFNPSPAAGNFLATHWNTATSFFLATAPTGPTPTPSPVPAPVTTGTLTLTTPVRLLDTTVAGNSTRDLVVGGVAPVPAGATGAILNVTVASGTAPSFLTVYPAGVARPGTSNVNFVAGQTIANQVTVGLSSSGAITIYNLAGNVRVIVDLMAWVN